MAETTCCLRASGRRFAAKRYLATSTFVPEVVAENHFEFSVSTAADHALLIKDLERFLNAPQLSLQRLFSFPGVERVTMVVRVAPRADGDRVFVLPARVCAALARHGLELEVIAR